MSTFIHVPYVSGAAAAQRSLKLCLSSDLPPCTLLLFNLGTPWTMDTGSNMPSSVVGTTEGNTACHMGTYPLLPS